SANTYSFGGVGTNRWAHVVAVHDSVNNELRIYLDSFKTQTNSYSSGVFDGPTSFAIAAPFGGATSLTFGGRIDEVGYWKNRALTDDDVTELYNNGNGLSLDDILCTGGGFKHYWSKTTKRLGSGLYVS